MQLPGALPGHPFSNSGSAEAQCGQKGDGFRFDQFADEGRQVKVGATSVQFCDLPKLDVAFKAVGKPRASAQLDMGPILCFLQAPEQPSTQCTALLFIPRFYIPAAFALGLLDKGDVAVGFDDGDSSFHQCSVVRGPVGGQFRDRCRSVSQEPGCFQFAIRHVARHDNLEGTLAEADGWWRLIAERDVVFHQAVKSVALPIELLLSGDHLLEQLS